MAGAELRTWQADNQQYLAAALQQVRGALRRHSAPGEAGDGADAPLPAWSQPTPPALATLCGLFGLSAFERGVLLLCAGCELDSRFPSLCAQAQGDPQRPFASFGLALAALPEAHWSALLPTAPLRRWRLVEPGVSEQLTGAPLRISERVLHYLVGLHHLDEGLAGLVTPVRGDNALVPSQRALAEQAAAMWSRAERVRLPVLQLHGEDRLGMRAVAAAICDIVGLKLGVLSVESLPLGAADLERLARLWECEASLSGSALLLDAAALEASDGARAAAATRLAERLDGALIVTARERLPLFERPSRSFAVERPSGAEQRALWREALGVAAERLNGQIDRLTAQFDLGAHAIRGAVDELAGDMPSLAELWDAARGQARPRLDELAQRIAGGASWDDLVLPAAQSQILRDIAAHVRQRARVYEEWGFAAQGSRGLGISALFAGASGTGKTMAAEVLANELRLDLYRIDLSQVVSKYIGETEKNLRQIFNAAEAGGAILLFDEADALFGKRSEVKDSHDRYANIEVSYLLQRMEQYRGLAILTTNLKQSLDGAFLRRIRFVIQFPFPDSAQRAAIWRRIFPRATPTEALDVEKLARLSVAGGNIRNIALNAAFLAADGDEAVQMRHLLRAARAEYSKLERTLTDAEVEGWRGES